MINRRWTELLPITIIAGLAAAVGVGYSLMLGQVLRYGDEQEYLAIARNLLATGTYSIDGTNPTARRAPAWPGILLLTQYLGGDVRAARLVNFAFLAASGIVLSLLVRRLNLAAGTALVIACAYVLYPLNIYTAGTLYPQTLQALLVLALTGMALGGQHAGPAVAGVLSGVAILTTPAAILAVPLFWALAIHLGRWGRPLRSCGIAAAACIAVLAPWGARNAITLDALILTSTTGGENLLLGNNPGTTPSAGVNQDISAYLALTKGRSEVERDRMLRDQALALVMEDPIRYLGLYLRKALNWLSFENTLYVRSESSPLRSVVAFLSFYGLLACSAVSFLLVFLTPAYRHLRRALSGIALLYVGAGFAHAIFFTRVRFRLPFDGLLFLVAAPLADHLLHRWRAPTGGSFRAVQPERS